MTSSGFDGRARVASGSTPTASATTYHVTVCSGALRLEPASRRGVVLDVPLAHVRARSLGRGGSVVVEVDTSPLLLDFSEQEDTGSPGAAARARRVVGKGRGRLRRDRFLKALGASAP